MKKRNRATEPPSKNHSATELPLFFSLFGTEIGAEIGADQTANFPPSMAPEQRRALADKVPFFLRLWWLREDSANEHLIRLVNQMFTTPVATPYSDPLCDAGSADILR